MEHSEDKIKDRTIELEQKKELAEKLNRDLQENFQTLELFYEALQVKISKHKTPFVKYNTSTIMQTVDITRSIQTVSLSESIKPN